MKLVNVVTGVVLILAPGIASAQVGAPLLGYLPDGTMVIVTNGQSHIGQQAEVMVQNLLQTGAGIIVFAEIKNVSAAKTDTAFITK